MQAVGIPFIVALMSGLYTSLWGAFKDSPYEGFKPKTFPRSILFHAVIFGVLYSFEPFAAPFRSLKLFQIFFLVMGHYVIALVHHTWMKFCVTLGAVIIMAHQ